MGQHLRYKNGIVDFTLKLYCQYEIILVFYLYQIKYYLGGLWAILFSLPNSNLCPFYVEYLIYALTFTPQT